MASVRGGRCGIRGQSARRGVTLFVALAGAVCGPAAEIWLNLRARHPQTSAKAASVSGGKRAIDVIAKPLGRVSVKLQRLTDLRR